jgi:hypothetical protein
MTERTAPLQHQSDAFKPKPSFRGDVRTLAFQVDLWSARGEFTRHMLEVMWPRLIGRGRAPDSYATVTAGHGNARCPLRHRFTR